MKNVFLLFCAHPLWVFIVLEQANIWSNSSFIKLQISEIKKSTLISKNLQFSSLSLNLEMNFSNLDLQKLCKLQIPLNTVSQNANCKTWVLELSIKTHQAYEFQAACSSPSRYFMSFQTGKGQLLLLSLKVLFCGQFNLSLLHQDSSTSNQMCTSLEPTEIV